MPKKDETDILREELKDNFWYAGLPLAALTSLTTSTLIKRGILLTPPGVSPRVKVIIYGVAGLVYGTLPGRNCVERILDEAPDSETATEAREKLLRRLSATVDPKEEMWRDYYQQMVDLEKEGHKIITNPNLGKGRPFRTELEKELLDECRLASFYYFSLPPALISSGLMYWAQKRNLVRSSAEINHRWLCRMPRALFAGLLGYYVGGVLYRHGSSDCAERFIVNAPNSMTAKVVCERSGLDLRDVFPPNCFPDGGHAGAEQVEIETYDLEKELQSGDYVLEGETKLGMFSPLNKEEFVREALERRKKKS